ncbi:MAG: hypothetical protein RLW87_13635 [Alphaproteobacteria bacterium]
MPVSPNRDVSPPVSLLLIAAALWVGAAGAGVAQAQVQLFPPVETESTASEAPAPAQPSAPEGMSVESLDSVDAEAVGAVVDPSEALPPTLWTGLSRATVAALIDGLPAAGDYPAARSLSRRLLLTAASLPPADSDPPISVLRARVAALARLGFAADAATLAQTGADALRDPQGQAALAGAQLAAFDLPGACATAVQASTRDTSSFWAKLLAFCQAVAGQKDQASLAAQTLLDTGEDDPLYFMLMDSITLDLAPEVGGMTAAGPLHYAMLRYADAPVPADLRDPNIALLAVQRSDDLAAAEAAALRGLLPPGDLADKYLAEKFKDSALDTPLEVLDRISPAGGRALLYQVLLRWEIPALRAEAVSTALNRASADGVGLAVAPVFAGPALDIPPSADLLWFAEDAARLFYRTGHIDRARAWHALLRNAALTDTAAAESDARLWHLAMLTGETGTALGRSRQGWEEAVVSGARDADRGRAHLAFLQALIAASTGAEAVAGEAELRAAAMAAGAEDGPGASALTLDLLDQAASAGRSGETAALSIAALASAPAPELSPSTVTAVVRALRRAGLQRDARRLAVEAAVLAEPEPRSPD